MSLKTLLSILLCSVVHVAVASDALKESEAPLDNPSAAPSTPFSNLWLGALGSYTDFKFNSVAGENYNSFDGYSQQVAIAGNNIVLAPSWTAGVSLFKIETHLGAKVGISPGIPAIADQSTRNNTLYAHVMKQFNANYFLDLSAAYGWNKVNTTSFLAPGTRSQQIGYSSTHSSNWFASATGLYSKSWKRFVLTANARLLYSEVNTGSYPFIFQSNLPAQVVQPLSNQAWYLMENVEVGYNLEKFPLWTVFANTGLVQVLSFTNSRALIGVPINGFSPQLNLDKNGFRVGGGLGYTHKQFTVRIEEQYYSAGSTYSSYQTLLGIKYAFA